MDHGSSFCRLNKTNTSNCVVFNQLKIVKFPKKPFSRKVMKWETSLYFASRKCEAIIYECNLLCFAIILIFKTCGNFGPMTGYFPPIFRYVKNIIHSTFKFLALDRRTHRRIRRFSFSFSAHFFNI